MPRAAPQGREQLVIPCIPYTNNVLRMSDRTDHAHAHSCLSMRTLNIEPALMFHHDATKSISCTTVGNRIMEIDATCLQPTLFSRDLETGQSN